jgi:peptide-methionine (R)-S-oxide reductase
MEKEQVAKLDKIEKTDAEWRAELTPEQYYVMRQKGTEPAFSGALYRNHADGTYRCGACGTELFSSDTKFESGSGWPSFTVPANAEAVHLHEDKSHGMTRTEVTCARCGATWGMCSRMVQDPAGCATASIRCRLVLTPNMPGRRNNVSRCG